MDKPGEEEISRWSQASGLLAIENVGLRPNLHGDVGGRKDFRLSDRIQRPFRARAQRPTRTGVRSSLATVFGYEYA